MSPLPTPGPGTGGGLPVSSPQQMAAAEARAQHMQQQFKLRMQIAENLQRIKHKLIVMSGKGGVGKSTVAVNLAASLHAQGHKVGLLDLDLTNPNVPIMLSLEDALPGGDTEGGILPVEVKDGFKVMSTGFLTKGQKTAIIWRGPIKMNMIHQLLGNVKWGDLDYLVIDLPPGTSDEPLSIAQLLRDADGVVVVTTPQAVSVLDVKKSIQFAQTMDLKVLGVVENMGTFCCPHCKQETDIFGRGGGEEISKEYGVKLLGQIPLDPRVVMAGNQGVPYVWREKDIPAAKAFEGIIANVKGQIQNK
ncbi:MAG TPA: Mrp/NBP35 family ATP-binding protein [Candidatus Thermoplasmatota archaeon]|nr:Mrp/NBP35 family ATP-binding protein [Candidatus Thermoplasmatota archaeon]